MAEGHTYIRCKGFAQLPRGDFAWNDVMSVCSVKGNISYKRLCMYFSLILIWFDSSSGPSLLNWSYGVM